MTVLKAVTLFALIYITSFLLQAGSGSAVQSDSLKESAVDYLVTVPVKILKELINITHKSKGLQKLWLESFRLTADYLLNAEVRIKYICQNMVRVLCMLLVV